MKILGRSHIQSNLRCMPDSQSEARIDWQVLSKMKLRQATNQMQGKMPEIQIDTNCIMYPKDIYQQNMANTHTSMWYIHCSCWYNNITKRLTKSTLKLTSYATYWLFIHLYHFSIDTWRWNHSIDEIYMYLLLSNTL